MRRDGVEGWEWWLEEAVGAMVPGPGEPGCGTLVDVGANVGQWTKALAGRFAHVHAFEPDERALPWLRAELPGNVTVHPCAVDEHKGHRIFNLFEESVHTGAAAHGCTIGAGAPLDQVRVEAVALDQLYMSQEIQRPVRLVKVDVEGMEYSVLRGAVGLLKRERPGLIVECHELHLFALVTRLLGDLNYGFDVVRHPDYRRGSELWLGHCWVVGWPG